MVGEANAASEPCTPQKIREIVNSPAGSTQIITCNLALRSSVVVRAKLMFSGLASSGVRLQCNGAQLRGGESDRRQSAIEIRSVHQGRAWSQAQNIQIEACQLTGSIRVWGMDDGGIDYGAKAASALQNFTQQARAVAPTNIMKRYHFYIVNLHQCTARFAIYCFSTCQKQ